MTSINQLLDEYGESHQHPVNKKIHWICVPLIVWSLLAMISTIQIPTFFHKLPVTLNWVEVITALAMVYYFLVSASLAVGILIVFVLMIFTINILSSNIVMLLNAAVLIFVLAWIGQFIGHNIEGKRPSFIKDLQFLLVGPLWLLSSVYRKLGIAY